MMNLYKRVYPKWTYKERPAIGGIPTDDDENINKSGKKTVHFNFDEPMDQ